MTVTHPFHPLRGQRVEVVRIRRGADPDLIVRHPDGLHAAIALDGTDYTTLPDIEPSSVPPHLLDFDGLCLAVQLIDRIRQKSCPPAADDDDGICVSTGDKL